MLQLSGASKLERCLWGVVWDTRTETSVQFTPSRTTGDGPESYRNPFSPARLLLVRLGL